MSRLNLGNDEPKYVTFEELLRTSDIISVHVPLSDRTRHLIGKKEIDMMKENIIIINTARGPSSTREPEIHPGLMKNENAILLPHIGTATIDTRKCMEVTMLDNVKNGLFHKQLLTPVPEHAQAAR
ncbi:unnamed protein product [Clonostachys rosea f. rosea IK726]|uniref:Uncharacterized protein n=1 Tax=Clonostachys rosea f. rosea IK726 TaxID=1349383 RepID=A0ACA9U8I4_BIOOC|nr:unnamed protein product [Clonostachys rosea f. rosea IK726]